MRVTRVIPHPNGSRSLGEWAVKLVSALNEDRADAKAREPLMPSYLMSNDMSSATEDGVIMFDPVNRCLVVSLDGEWKKLAFVT